MAEIKQGDLNEAEKQEILKEGGSPYKPLTGYSTSLDPTNYQNVIRNSDNSYTMTLGPGDPRYNNTSSDYQSRVGDYVFTKTGPVAAQNSITDLEQKYRIIVGGTKKKGASFSDWMSALGSGIGAYLGAPTDTSNLLSTAATAGISQAAKNVPGLSEVWGFGTFLNSLSDAYKRSNEEWAKTLVDYKSGVSFVDDGNGGKKAVIDYNAIGTAGEAGSGYGIKDITNTDKTGAEITGDNQLKIVASDTFLNSNAYAELVKDIRDKLKDLSVEEANKVVDEETGATLIETIDKYVKDTESMFYYTAQSTAILKQVAPSASDEALARGSYTMLSGHFKDKDLENINIYVYDRQNVMKEVNAKEYYDSIANLSKVERDNYMTSLGDRINDDDISDDEKAVLQGQANALYALSSNSEQYKGMYQKDFWDSICDTGGLVTGIRLGDFIGVEELESFTNDDIFSGLLGLASSVGGMLTMGKLTNVLEKGIRAGTTKIGSALGDNKVGEFLKNLSSKAPQDVGQSLPKALAESGKAGLKSWAKKTAVQVGYQLAADTAYDAAKAVAYAATGNDYDFAKELATDFVLDTIMTYGPAAYRESMSSNGEKYELKPQLDEDGHIIMDNNGVREMEVVKVTAEQLSKERAQKILDATGSDTMRKVQEMFFDQNAGMSRLALDILAKTGDNFLFRQGLRFASGIRTLTRFAENEFKRTYSDSLTKLNEVMKDVAPRWGRDLSKADIEYINAAGNKARFLQIANGDVEAIKKINNFYSPYIKGVSAERAAQLDQLRSALAGVASDVMTNYKEKGLLSDKAFQRMTAYEGYYPIWSKNKVYTGKEILQTRKDVKQIFDPEKLIKVEDLDNPLVSLAGEIANMARNVAINERALWIREAASIAGLDVHIVEDPGGALNEVSNLRELNAKFEERYQNIRKAVLNKYPDQVKWQAGNDKLVLASGAFAKYDEVARLEEENKDLHNRLRREQRELKKSGTEKEAQTAADKIFATKVEIEANRQARKLAIDEIRDEAVKTMEAAAKKSLSTAGLDIEKYVTNHLTNGLKKALKRKNVHGAIQNVLNDAVKYANPWVDPELVIQSRAEVAAQNFRKRAVKEAAFRKSAMPRTSEQVNAAVDRAVDSVLNKVLGNKRNRVTDIGGEGSSYSYSAGDRTGTVTYRLGGQEYKMKLAGDGADMIIDELERAEATVKGGALRQKLGMAANKVANAKRYLTTSMDPTRMLPNLIRDWTRGIVTTGGLILLSPKDLRDDVVNSGHLNDEAIARMDQGWRQVADNMSGTTFTKSLEVPKKNRPKTLSAALDSPDAEGFVVYNFGRTLTRTAKEAWGKGGTLGEKFSVLQDTSETYTRMRAMTNAYYNEVGKQISKGSSMEKAIERGMEAAYFYGVEATQNFGRRGRIIETFAKQVPYLTQKFATLESFKYAWIDDPIAVTRSLRATVTAYAGAIAILLSNDESRKKYFMLSEYERSNNILVPLDNDTIITIPLDDTIAAFLTPYRRAIETLNGVDPEAFYLWGTEFLGALSPLDLTGFSEGDKFNVVRGLERLGSELIPTWAQPIIEAVTQRDLYYGSDISMTEEEVGEYYGIYGAEPGQQVSKNKYSKTLAKVSNTLGMPQWMLQNFLSEYGGNVAQYAVPLLDKLAGAKEDEQGGKDFMDAIFKPFTGNDSDSVSAAFNAGISALQQEKKKLQNKLKNLNTEMAAAKGDEKDRLLNERQRAINAYGIKVTDFLSSYLSAYEITGGLSATQANRVWYLYVLYDENDNADMVSGLPESGTSYYYSKAKSLENKSANAIAAMSGLGKYIDSRITNPTQNYYDTYGQQLFTNSVYGSKMGFVNELYKILEKNQGMKTSTGDSFYDLREKAQDARSKAYDNQDYTSADAIAYSFDREVVLAVLNYIQQSGHSIEDVIDNTQVINYLSDWIMVPSSFQTTKKGKYISSLREGAQKEKAFKKPYIKYLFGLQED